MNTHPVHLPLASRSGAARTAAFGLAAALVTAWIALHPVPAHGQQTAAPTSSYDAQVKACNDGSSGQDRATCLREAGAARADAAKLGSTDSAQLKRNALARCESLPDAEKADCKARINDNDTSGSVKDGGLLREHREIVPASPGDTAK